MLFLAFLVIAPTVFVYFLIIKGTDRYEPEPVWLLSVMFLWGAVVATGTAIVFNDLGMGALSMTLQAEADTELVQHSTAAIIAPLVEETTKGVGLLLLWILSALWIRELDGPLDGAIYGGMVGLGFTLTEDILYAGRAGGEAGAEGLLSVFLLRTVLAGLSHASFTAVTGLFIGIAAESTKWSVRLLAPIGGWVGAVGLHSLHNALVTIFAAGGAGFAVKLVLFWVFDAAFFVVILLLAVRDRRIVLRELASEVPALLRGRELVLTTSYLMLVPFWNLVSLRRSPGGYARGRSKQLLLIELAFTKHRRRRDATARLDRQETELRDRIRDVSAGGGFIGPAPA